MINKSWTITADIEVDADSEGMVVTQGGLTGGYGLYFKAGKPTFVYNYLDVERFVVASADALPPGKTRLVVDFVSDGKPGEHGKGGALTITANGKQVASGHLPKTAPIQFSLGEGMDIGEDVGSPVDFTYKLPFAFTGEIEKVTYELK